MITVRIKSVSGISDGEVEFETLEDAEMFVMMFFGVTSMDDLAEWAGDTYTRHGGTTQVSIDPD